MTFTTLTFVLFLGAVWSVYWLLSHRAAQNGLLLAASYVFYGWWDWRFCSLMLVSSAVDYFAGLWLGRLQRRSARRVVLGLSLLTNLGLLGFFKYFNFFIDSAGSALAALGLQPNLPSLNVILPVGISFYTFQTLSYTIDVYWRRIEPTRSILDFFAYVAFFPQLVAGPIERAAHLLPQFTLPRTFDERFARDGLRLILWGFAKKLVLADNLARLVDAAYDQPAEATGPALVAATIAFAFQIYCDFSAYSDIAIGTARLFGFRLMRNFAHPYFSQDLGEFWRRWHISLSTWFRDYVFIPLGGSRPHPRHGPWAKLFTARNILATFVISGLWHGASWNFVIWGTIHGIGVLPVLLASRSGGAEPKRRASDTPGGERDLPPAGVLCRMAGVFTLVCAAWVFFRADSLGDACTVYGRVFTDERWLTHAGQMLHLLFDQDHHLWTSIHLIAFVAIEWLSRRREHPLQLCGWPRGLRWTVYTLMVYDILMFGTRAGGAFIYFQF